MDEARLIEKLRKIEALFAGTTSAGERLAAEQAFHRVLARLEALAREDPPVEYRFSMPDMWSRKVFVALLRRYGLTPYRYKRQRYTTVMVQVPARFVEETLWPEFEQLSDALEVYLGEVTERVVTQVLHADSSEPVVVNERGQLPPPTAPAPMDPAPAPAPSSPSAGLGDASASDGAHAALPAAQRSLVVVVTFSGPPYGTDEMSVLEIVFEGEADGGNRTHDSAIASCHSHRFDTQCGLLNRWLVACRQSSAN